MSALKIMKDGAWVTVGEYHLANIAVSGSYNDLTDTPQEGVDYLSPDAINNLVNGKTDNMVIIEDTTITDATIESLQHNTEYMYGELSSLNVTLPESIGIDYTSLIAFSTPSEIPENYSTFPSDLYFKGDECDAGIFIPIASTRYTMLFYYDGVKIVGLVSGIEVTA